MMKRKADCVWRWAAATSPGRINCRPFGVVFNPLTARWTESSDVGVNYMMTVVRDAA